MSSSTRTRSTDRHTVDSDDESQRGFRHTTGQGPNFFSNLLHSSRGATDGIAKSGKGFFNKIARSGSGTADPPTTSNNPDSYVFRVIDKPLVQQTRITRIKKNLSGAGDKTEFWMPALAYRCIDYLNCNGVDAEGLYRQSGSIKEIKKWQIRFDTGPDYDVDLLEDGIELYDLHVVSTMLKSWFRDLPDELFPRDIQETLRKEYDGVSETPQAMRDALSDLPPYNYYLLFAITCHISLLHAHADKNKMTFQNLSICFQPCIKIDSFCFKLLVQDWRNCWQGCRTESQHYMEEMEFAKRQEEELLSGTTLSNNNSTVALSTLTQRDNRAQTPQSLLRQPPPSPTAGTNRDRSASPFMHGNARQPQTAPPSIEPVAQMSPIKM